jgi:hypothetical protein
MNPCDNAIATTKLKIKTLQKEIFFENVIIPLFQGLYMFQSVPFSISAMVVRCQFVAVHSFCMMSIMNQFKILYTVLMITNILKLFMLFTLRVSLLTVFRVNAPINQKFNSMETLSKKESPKTHIRSLYKTRYDARFKLNGYMYVTCSFSKMLGCPSIFLSGWRIKLIFVSFWFITCV